MLMTVEESKVLQFLGLHPQATLAEIGRGCLANAPSSWVERVVANLDWLGYVTRFAGSGANAVLFLTAKGKAEAGMLARH